MYPSAYNSMEHVMSASGWQPEVLTKPCSPMGTFVLSLCWACSLSGGKFESGIAENQVTTALGNMALQECFDGISENALEKERAQYYTLSRIQNTVKHKLLPQMTVSNKANKETENGAWTLQGDHQKLKIGAFIMAMVQLDEEKLKGNEFAEEALKKMASAAGGITVIICEHEEDAQFIENYQNGENADHDQMQNTNARFTNRGRMLIRARIQVGKQKTSVTAQDLVTYFNDLEPKRESKQFPQRTR